MNSQTRNLLKVNYQKSRDNKWGYISMKHVDGFSYFMKGYKTFTSCISHMHAHHQLARVQEDNKEKNLPKMHNCQHSQVTMNKSSHRH